MKTFVINLDKNTERLARFNALMRRYELSCERIRAIYGMELTLKDKRILSNRFAWWCVKGYTMRDGELGAALSHQLVYRTMIENNISLACVFEDDANPNQYLTEQLRRIESEVDPEKPQVYLLADHTSERRTYWSVRKLKEGAFAEGYIITLPAARALLKDNFPVKTPADSWSYWAKKGLVELYQATPASCNQEWEEAGYRSDVTPDNSVTTSVKKMTAPGKFCWILNRITGKICEKIFFSN